jgi:pilus assembly protein CpaB
MSNKTILVISIVAGILALWLSALYLKHEKEKFASKEHKVYVIAAKKDLPSGTVLALSDLDAKQLPESQVDSRDILGESYNEILGKKLINRVARGDTIQWSDIEGGYNLESGLAAMVLPGMRAVSIAIDSVGSVSSMVKPNDRVDIIGSFQLPSARNPEQMEMVTLTVLQDVTVLATGQQTARSRSLAGSARYQSAPVQQSSYSTITLEVTPQEAELLTFTQNVRGKLTLTLRNSADVGFITNPPTINFEHIQNHLPELNRIRQRDIRHKKNI